MNQISLIWDIVPPPPREVDALQGFTDEEARLGRFRYDFAREVAARAPLADLDADAANFTGLVLGCIEAKFCK